MPFTVVTEVSQFKISLARTRCFGPCPSYHVEIDGNGNVTFDGGDFVRVPGRHSAHVRQAAVRELVEAFRKADYFSAKDYYSAAVTDNPTSTISLSINGQSKRVDDYAGELVGMPTSIEALERKIDDVAGTDRWITGTQDIVALLDSERWDFRSSTDSNLSVYSSAITTDNDALLKRYLSKAAPVFAPSSTVASPICVASGEAKLGLVKQMMRSSMKQQEKKDGLSPIPLRVMNQCLASAAQKGDLPTLLYWLDHGADPTMEIEKISQSDSSGSPAGCGHTLLVCALISRRASAVQKLLKYKLDMRPPASDRSLLGFALRMSSADTPAIVESLVKAGADVNDHSGVFHQTPIFAAYHAPGAVRPLLAAGANIEARDDNGSTPLIRGAMDEEMVRELLSDGADPTAVNNDGDTALSVSRKYDCVPCTALIIASLRQSKDKSRSKYFGTLFHWPFSSYAP